jgi:nucleotide-binding universal stress UspA family protein
MTEGPVVAGISEHRSGCDVLVLAAALARARGNAVIAAHVSDPGPSPDGGDRRRARDRWERIGELRRVVAEALESSGAGLEVEIYDFQASSAARGLHELAADAHASAIVVGSTHRGPLGRVAIGTTGSRLLLKAPCPVAVAPHGLHARERTRIDNVAVAVDGCSACEGALQEAIALSGSLGARLTAITVVPRGSGIDADERVDAMLERTGADGIERRRLEGGPAAELTRASPGLDLLMMGCRTSGGLLGHPTVGSVSRDLMRTSTAPVLVVPEGMTL